MKRNDYTTAKLKHAEHRRQAILDHVRANPWCDYDSMVDAVRARWPETDPNTVRGAVANMLAKRELGATGIERDRNYIALVETTISADAVRDEYLNRKAQYREKARKDRKPATASRKAKPGESEQATVKQISAGRTRYSCGHTKPAQDSRGQGCLRGPASISLNQIY